MHIGLDPEVLRFDFNVNGPAIHGRSSGSGWELTSSRGTYRPTGRCSPGCSLAIRRSQCGAIRLWRPGGIVEPVLQAWRGDAVPPEEYEAGSDGPTTLPRIG
jgi:glucose-6-phosphate 1-dehydrogenase